MTDFTTLKSREKQKLPLYIYYNCVNILAAYQLFISFKLKIVNFAVS